MTKSQNTKNEQQKDLCITSEQLTENIFNLTDVSDIPAEISAELSNDVFAKNILTLFNKAGRNLTIDEVTVGYYRQFNVIKTKKQIMVKLYNMAKAKEAKIRSIPKLKGVYGVVEDRK